MVALACLSAQPASADIVAQGRVVDFLGKPIAGVTAALAGQRNRVRTDPNGYFFLTARPKAGEERRLTLSATGLAPLTHTLRSDTTLCLTFALHSAGQAVAPPVTVSRTVEQRNVNFCTEWNTGYSRCLDIRTKLYGLCRKSSTAMVACTVFALSNGLVSVDVCPALGMRVLRARDLTGPKPIDILYEWKDWANDTRRTNIGGIEANFPFYEGGLALLNQEAGYRIVNNPDGSACLAMNMRMDHRQTEMDMGFMGKYGDRPLSSWVTLLPGQASFEVTHRADNPNPTRRNRRLWVAAAFPRSDAEAIFPSYWAVFHGAQKYWRARGRHIEEEGSSFSPGPHLPFAGVWYEGERVNRLRIADPTATPGMKIYMRPRHDDEGVGFMEVWSGTNEVFEVPDKFVDAYEPLVLTQTVFVTRTIGRAVYANEHLAISLQTRDSLRIVTTRPGRLTVTGLPGGRQTLADSCGPARPVCVRNADSVAVALDGAEIYRGPIPPPLDTSTTRLGELLVATEGFRANEGKERVDLSVPGGFEYAEPIEASDIQSKWADINKFGVALLDTSYANHATKAQLLAAARAHYSLGRLDQARWFARRAGAGPESAYLLGLVAWEKGERADFSAAGVHAGYHAAMQHLQEGNRSAAIEALRGTVAQRPDAFRPRLMLAFLARDLDAAARCAMENPGSPEAQLVLAELGYDPAKQDLAALVSVNTGAGAALEDFRSEIVSGTWRHGRRYEYVPDKLKATYPFPDKLRRAFVGTVYTPESLSTEPRDPGRRRGRRSMDHHHDNRNACPTRFVLKDGQSN